MALLVRAKCLDSKKHARKSGLLMATKAKRKTTPYSTHEYKITLHHPTGETAPKEPIVVIGSRDAYYRQTESEGDGYLVIVHNNTTDTEEYRSMGL